MPLRKGDILDEHKRHPGSCGLVVKVMGGGEGFEKIVCCDHDLTEEDIVAQMGSPTGRARGQMGVGMILDEKKLYPTSCGLRVIIMDGGAGFKEIRCCGHSLTFDSRRGLDFDRLRRTPTEQPGPGTGATSGRPASRKYE